MDPLRPCGPSLRPPQGPDVRLPKIVTFRRGDAATRPVIGPRHTMSKRLRGHSFQGLGLSVKAGFWFVLGLGNKRIHYNIVID